MTICEHNKCCNTSPTDSVNKEEKEFLFLNADSSHTITFHFSSSPHSQCILYPVRINHWGNTLKKKGKNSILYRCQAPVNCCESTFVYPNIRCDEVFALSFFCQMVSSLTKDPVLLLSEWPCRFQKDFILRSKGNSQNLLKATIYDQHLMDCIIGDNVIRMNEEMFHACSAWKKAQDAIIKTL